MSALSPAALYALMLCSAAVMGLAYVRLRQRHREANTTRVEPQAGSFNIPTEHTIRIKYSSRQVVESSNVPGNYNETLNLDNAATMVQMGRVTTIMSR